LNFHLHPQFWPFDPSLADKIVCAMSQAGVDPEKFIAAAFKAVFEGQRNLADDADLAVTLADAGYEPYWLEPGKSAEAAEGYAANLAQGLTEGIFGSPSYLLDGEVFWGQDRLDLLDDALTSGRKSFSADA
jgi:2-hydroxychromene-2-carboxylate isomerase